MEEKRYQVFISSTFEDLKDERRAVQDIVINTGDFPVQMESFPAADENQFEFIKSLINVCDYYILIIAGRYGSLSDDGLSYTHKEFRYAVEQNVPILVMIHGNLGKIESGKSESTDAGRKSLQEFIIEAETGRLRKTWNNLEGLKLAVREALDHAKATKPRVGWVRGNSIASLAVLEELNQVRKENEDFRRKIGALEIGLDLPPIPKPNEAIGIELFPNNSVRDNMEKCGTQATVVVSWINIFPIFYENLCYERSDWNGEYSYNLKEERSRVAIGSAIAGAAVSFDTANYFKLKKVTFNRLMNYYLEAGLMHPEGAEQPFTEIGQKFAR